MAGERRPLAGCELGQALLIGTLAATLPGLPGVLLLIGGAQVRSAIRTPAGRGVVPLLVAQGAASEDESFLSKITTSYPQPL